MGYADIVSYCFPQRGRHANVDRGNKQVLNLLTLTSQLAKMIYTLRVMMAAKH